MSTTAAFISLRVSLEELGPHSPTNPPQATWGVGAICGYMELTETPIISHKPVIEKARKKDHISGSCLWK